MSSEVRARACVRELWGLTPDERPERRPFVFGEYLRKRMNASGVTSSFMARVCYSTHGPSTKADKSAEAKVQTVLGTFKPIAVNETSLLHRDFRSETSLK